MLSMQRPPLRKPVILTDLALLAFGGIDQITGWKIKNTFAKAFSHERNLSCWKRCWAVPLTRLPPFCTKVRNELESVDAQNDQCQLKLKELEHWNHYYCDFLTANSYAGFQLKMFAPVWKTGCHCSQYKSKRQGHLGSQVFWHDVLCDGWPTFEFWWLF